MNNSRFVDYFGADASELRKKRLFLFDMDGTIYNEDTLFDGTTELLSYIEQIGGKYIFITNNSSKSVKNYVKKVNRLGIEASKENFFTSTQAAALMLRNKHPNKKVYCQGTSSFIKELREFSINVTDDVQDDAEVILVGFDTELTSLKLRNTCKMLQRGIPYYATNPDLACPVEFGFIPDCGSICMMLENATGRKPVYIGKPEAVMINTVMDKFGASKEETAVIGDRLYTDIAAGNNAGVTSICVLTGEATISSITQGDIKPSYVFENVKALYSVLKGLRI